MALGLNGDLFYELRDEQHTGPIWGSRYLWRRSRHRFSHDRASGGFAACRQRSALFGPRLPKKRKQIFREMQLGIPI